MALKLQPGFANVLTQKWVDVFNGTSGTGSSVRIYTGTQPGTAGGSTSGFTQIVAIAGVKWSNATSGTALLDGVFTGTAAADGTVGWGRIEAPGGEIIEGDCGTAATSTFLVSKSTAGSGDVLTLNSATFVQST